MLLGKVIRNRINLGLSQSWNEKSLATQFAIAGGVVMLLSMVIIGRLVAGRIEEAVVRNTANATSQYMESFIAPLSQELDDGDTLAPGARRALEEIFQDTALGERVVSYKLWNLNGRVVEASDKEIVGKVFEVTENLQRAAAGEVRADFEDLNDVEDVGENALGLPLLEIYSPIREIWSGRVIGVAEFYEVATQLQSDLIDARRNSWLAVASVFMTIGGILYSIVRRGSQTIDQQMEALAALSSNNAALRRKVQQAASRAAAVNDQALRRIGADLHDGPAQQLSFAALRLDSLRPAISNQKEFDAISRAIKDALGEMRDISRGLSLPEIEERSVCEIVFGVVDAHTARCGTPVRATCDMPDDIDVPAAVKICIYRFVQEGLNNAWRYADGPDHEVLLNLVDDCIWLKVKDRGDGFASENKPASDETTGMGLSGLRDRVESLGGIFEARNRTDGKGAEISMFLDLKAM